ncbi:thioredoxin family protein [Cellulophaga sp. F20128]|uniref:thioredoxin family protein n=1 Tax=Cellulophaga sp. F20128 TaxID=2926413 RepID=UPI001FF6423A|nr:thioredoxin family protein [Cellulophaga sp. F20128]MCK0155922.1 thioredoxin family protein [Cellulophaga sp. F20128]
MKNHTQLILASLVFISPLLGSAQIVNRVIKDYNNREILVGKINKVGLTNPTFAPWFTPKYNAYEIDTTILNTLKTHLKDYKIVAFIGTWCGDSKREIPRFYKILETVNYPMSHFSLVAVDNSKDNYKKSPNGEEKGLHIIRVPTFIIYKDNKEINRIIESPVVSLEKDLAVIIQGGEYVPNFPLK